MFQYTMNIRTNIRRLALLTTLCVAWKAPAQEAPFKVQVLGNASADTSLALDPAGKAGIDLLADAVDGSWSARILLQAGTSSNFTGADLSSLWELVRTPTTRATGILLDLSMIPFGDRKYIFAGFGGSVSASRLIWHESPSDQGGHPLALWSLTFPYLMARARSPSFDVSGEIGIGFTFRPFAGKETLDLIRAAYPIPFGDHVRGLEINLAIRKGDIEIYARVASLYGGVTELKDLVPIIGLAVHGNFQKDRPPSETEAEE